MITFVDSNDPDFQKISLRWKNSCQESLYIKTLAANDEISMIFERTIQVLQGSEPNRIAKKTLGHKVFFREVDFKLGNKFAEIKTSIRKRQSIVKSNRQLKTFCDFIGYGHDTSTLIYITVNGEHTDLSILNEIGNTPFIQLDAKIVFDVAVQLGFVSDLDLFQNAIDNVQCSVSGGFATFGDTEPETLSHLFNFSLTI